jgi:hypothetical protein
MRASCPRTEGVPPSHSANAVQRVGWACRRPEIMNSSGNYGESGVDQGKIPRASYVPETLRMATR